MLLEGRLREEKAWIGEEVDFYWRLKRFAKASMARRGSYEARACDLPAVASTSGRCGGF